MVKYLIQVWGDVQPILHGPYPDDDSRHSAALDLAREDEGTIIALDLDAGKPEVHPALIGPTG